MSEYQKGVCDCCLQHSTRLKKTGVKWLCPGDYADETIQNLRTENARLKGLSKELALRCREVVQGKDPRYLLEVSEQILKELEG